jgi:hypothetical protein
MKTPKARITRSTLLLLTSAGLSACTSIGLGISIPIGGIGSIGVGVGSDGRVNGGVSVGRGGVSVGVGGTANLPQPAPPTPADPAASAPQR